jgi:hypothetical protein
MWRWRHERQLQPQNRVAGAWSAAVAQAALHQPGEERLVHPSLASEGLQLLHDDLHMLHNLDLDFFGSNTKLEGSTTDITLITEKLRGRPFYIVHMT